MRTQLRRGWTTASYVASFAWTIAAWTIAADTALRQQWPVLLLRCPPSTVEGGRYIVRRCALGIVSEAS